MGPLPSPHPATITSAMSCAAPTTDVKVSLAPVVEAGWDRAPTSPFPQLPSFETATQTMDASKLPSYTQSKSTRYHPYTRWIPALVDGTGLDRLFNTVFDEERVDVVPPPALLHGPRPTQPLVAAHIPQRRATPAPFLMDRPAANALDYELAQPDVVEFERRAQAVAGVILQEFVAGLRRAQQA